MADQSHVVLGISIMYNFREDSFYAIHNQIPISKGNSRKTDLHGKGIAGMAASIDDVEGRHRQNLQHATTRISHVVINVMICHVLK